MDEPKEIPITGSDLTAGALGFVKVTDQAKDIIENATHLKLSPVFVKKGDGSPELTSFQITNNQ